MRIRKRRLKKTAFKTPPGQSPAEPLPVPAAGEPQQIPPSPPKEPDWATVPFKSPKAAKAYQKLLAFCRDHYPCAAILHPETGLPHYLQGELEDQWQESPAETALSFLRENELMLAGLSRGTRLERVRQSDWGGDLQKITFVQTNKARIPLYGSYITCNYRLNRLHLVSGTLHPAPPKAIDGLTWGNTGWLEAKSIALRNLPPEIEPVRFDTPHDLTLESRRQNLLVDRWILPYLAPDAAEGVYRPIWRVIIVDQNEERWLTLVDAETQEVLSHEPDRVDTTVQADVYRTALDALNDQPAPETLDYGGGNTIFNADHIHAAGPRLVEPSGPNALNADRLLSATMFYQTRQMQHAFKTMLNNLSFSLSVTATNPDPTEDINTMLENIAGSAFYRPSTHTIHLPTGVAANPPILAVHEPGIDSEVICHEFTHAVTHFLEPGVFKFKSQYTPIGQLQRKFTGALDEGLAFFLGCIVGSNQRWADSAYRDWATAANGGPWRDLHLGPKSIAEAENNGDPAGVVHALGMWWAGIFLELSQDNNLGLDATLELVLTSFDALSGPIHDELVFANTLVQHGANNAQKTAIRNVLQAFGVNLA